jgi:hypothetical protein
MHRQNTTESLQCFGSGWILAEFGRLDPDPARRAKMYKKNGEKGRNIKFKVLNVIF